MRKFLHLFTGLAAVVMLWLPAAPAQAFKIYVGQIGASDAGSCLSPSAPCQTMQAALDKSQDGGEVDCVNSLDAVGILMISKAVTIDCGIQGTFGGTITINGAGIVVKLRNFTISGAFFGPTGISFVNGAELYLENCLIHNTSGFALTFRPTTPGSQLFVINSIFEQNGTLPGPTGAVLIQPQAGGSAGFVFDHVTFGLNVTALTLDSSSGGMGGFIKNSTVRASTNNGIVTSAGGTINLNIQNSSLVNNVGSALLSSGANSVVRVSDSDINSNNTGVSTASGGTVLSYKNNRIFGNNVDGTPLMAVPGVSGNLQ